MIRTPILEDLRHERKNSQAHGDEKRRLFPEDQIGAEERDGAVAASDRPALHDIAWTDEEITAFAAVLVNYQDEPLPLRETRAA